MATDASAFRNACWLCSPWLKSHRKTRKSSLSFSYSRFVDTSNDFVTGARKLQKAILDKINNAKDFDPVEYFRLTPLMVACLREDSAEVLSLLRFGIDTNEPVIGRNTREFNSLASEHSINWSKYSCLHFAVLLKCRKIIFFLLQNGANANIQNGEKMTPFHLAAQINDTLSANLFASTDLFKYKYFDENDWIQPNDHVVENTLADVNAVDYLGNTPLHYAIENEHWNFLKILLYAGADVNIVNSNKKTPVHIAKDHRAFYIIEYMFSEDFIRDYGDANPVDDTGFSHFHALCATDIPIEVIKNFLRNVTDINKAVDLGSSTYRGYTALHFSAEGGHLKIAKLLIDNGADVNANRNVCNVGCSTALHMAVLDCNIAMIKLLLRNKADVNARNGHGNTALQYALVERSQMMERLKENLEIRVNGRKIYRKVVTLLYKSGSDLRLKNNKGETALYQMARFRGDTVGFHIFLRFHNIKIPISPVVIIRDRRIGRIVTFDGHWRHETRCKKELEKLANFDISDELRYFKDLLYESPVVKPRRDSIPDTSISAFVKVFPIFGSAIERRYEKGVNNWKSGIESLEHLLNLPVLCCRNIAIYLSGKDMETLIEISNSLKKKSSTK